MNLSINPLNTNSVPAVSAVTDNAGSLAVGFTAVTCPHCLAEIPADSQWQSCPYCQKRLQICIWPVVRQNNKATTTLSDQATCFFHPDKAFQACCRRCGRFMCALCDLQLGAEHVCPICFERGRGDAGARAGEAEWRYRDVLYDSVAAMLGWGWIIIWPTIVIALPAVIFLHVKYRKAPRLYLIPRSGWRFWSAYVGLAWLPLLFASVFLLRWIEGRHRLGSAFRKISRVGTLTGGTKWYLSEDCLLAAKRMMYVVEYRRFYLRDLESIVVWPSHRWRLRLIVPGVLLAATGAALWTWANSVAGEIFVGASIAWCALELALGPTAESRIRTTGTTVDIPLMKRTQRAEKILAMINAAVLASRAPNEPSTTPAAPSARLEASETASIAAETQQTNAS